MAAKKAKPGTPRGAKAAPADRVVIEGVPPLEIGCSAVAALHAMLVALGIDLPHETLAVAGGNAFRLYVQLNRMGANDARHRQPLAGVAIAATSFATWDVLAETCDALGIQAEMVALERKPGVARAKAVWRKIEDALRDGRPVPACGPQGSFEHEWCLITGIDAKADRAYFRDATHRGDAYAEGPRGSLWQGWMPGPEPSAWMPHMIVTGRRGRGPDEQTLAERVVAHAVEAAREGFVGPNWVSGLAAYHAWVLQLGQDRWHAEASRHLREPALANSWLLSNTYAGRRAAGHYFSDVARHFAGRKNRALHKAGTLYSASAGALQTAGALFPNWGQGYEEAEKRHRAAELLAIAEEAERGAVEALEEAFEL